MIEREVGIGSSDHPESFCFSKHSRSLDWWESPATPAATLSVCTSSSIIRCYPNALLSDLSFVRDATEDELEAVSASCADAR